MLIPGSSNVSVKIKRISESLERIVNSKLSETDLTLTQFKILYVLSHCTDDGTATQKQIEDHLSISHPTAVGLFRRMESKGFIENLGREGKLSKVIRMTEMGSMALETNEPIVTEMERWLEEILGEQSFRIFDGCLDRIQSELQRKG